MLTTANLGVTTFKNKTTHHFGNLQADRVCMVQVNQRVQGQHHVHLSHRVWLCIRFEGPTGLKPRCLSS